MSDDYAAFDGRFPPHPFFTAEDFEGWESWENPTDEPSVAAVVANIANSKRDVELERLRSENIMLRNDVLKQNYSERLLLSEQENTRLREAMKHTLAMGHLTPGGSQEGWYKELLGEKP